jgi:hypothetical protein
LLFENLVVHGVAFHVRSELGEPVFGAGLRHDISTFAVVTMPKTAVDEHDLSPPRENQVRSARQIPGV